MSDILSKGASTSIGYQVEVRDNMPEIRPIVFGVKLIGKEWTKLRPEWLEGMPPHYNYPSEYSDWTELRRHELLPYHSAIALGHCFLAFFRLRQVEFRLVKCQLERSHTTTRLADKEPVKNNVLEL